ncbi:hypothetical protein K6V39_03345 [Streptococcus suis]|uniref:hypothetical protein n=1 Tax=Streptococcus suis TaxID=1307 RepID=UPI001C973306|nr:hypothetical protein [Streptococcus suis]MBY4961561.1 hypothetical protein [Streptococcus suis]MBY4967981.1 hypothetical protein [Streptococcus suis]MBY4979057.1 hypothetical protein [Streptococcus suis]MBY4987565.1 hypothetical protein [Streptococcus suis]MBY4994125.1 hypothetical protein [Streptococcus suis]
MPKKNNYFHIAFNLIILLLQISIISFIINLIMQKISIQNVEKFLFLGDTNFFGYIKLLYESSGILNTITITSVSLIIVLLLIEIALRIIKDSPINLLVSIYKTIRMRWFVYKINNDTLEQNKFTIYNNVVSHCTVNVQNQSIKIALRLPVNVDSVKLYKQAEPIIFEEIVNNNPNYYFSSPMRVGRWMQIFGSKR